jgi:hypothetical protein
MMHNKNYETNPRRAARKREDVISGVHFSASKRKKTSGLKLQNEPKAEGRAACMVTAI